jgi:hypothetical protein
MEDPWNPTAQEIEEWAFDRKSLEPAQDWMLALTWKREEKLYLELASNDKCPKQKYFLQLHYFIVGDAVRSKFQTNEQAIIKGFIEKGKAYSDSGVVKWIQRSEELIKHPDQFHYGLWCGGKLANQ